MDHENANIDLIDNQEVSQSDSNPPLMPSIGIMILDDMSPQTGEEVTPISAETNPGDVIKELSPTKKCEESELETSHHIIKESSPTKKCEESYLQTSTHIDDNNQEFFADESLIKLSPTLSPKPTECSLQSPDDESSQKNFKIKVINFHNKEIPIVTQNENGPCPLLAIINALIIKVRQIL